MIDSFLEKHGSPAQLERFHAGRLPEDELRRLARDILFRPLDAPRFERLEPHHLHHTVSCQKARMWQPTVNTVNFQVLEGYTGGMTDRQWLTQKAIETMAQDFPHESLKDHVTDVKITVRQHVGVCWRCEAVRNKLSVLVSATFHGLRLSREYAL